MSETRFRILSVGTAVPGPPVATAALAHRLGLDAERARWMDETLGIHARHLCLDLAGGPPHASLAELATTAARRALDTAAVSGEDIDTIVMTTATPDHLMPATVNLIADRLGIDHVPTFQIQAGATGAIQAIDAACQMLSTGRQRTALVIAGDVSTKQLDPDADLSGESAAVQLAAAAFGDAAAAAVLTSREQDAAPVVHRVVYRRTTTGYAPGHTADWLGAASRGAGGQVVTFDHQLMAEVVSDLASTLLTEILGDLGWQAGELARLLPPQLSGTLAATTARRLAIPADRCDSEVERTGNAANALPLLQLARALDRTGPGDRVAAIAVDPSGWAVGGLALQRN